MRTNLNKYQEENWPTLPVQNSNCTCNRRVKSVSAAQVEFHPGKPRSCNHHLSHFIFFLHPQNKICTKLLQKCLGLVVQVKYKSIAALYELAIIFEAYLGHSNTSLMELFAQKVPSHMIDRVLNTPLTLHFVKCSNFT